MSTMRIYLDVDGVIAPYDPVQKTSGWHYQKTRAAGLEIIYSPNLITALRNIPAEIVWLTSWEELAAIELAPEIGLPHYRTLTKPSTHDGSERGTQWWKWQALKNDNPNNFYWIDDELNTEPQAQEWATENGYWLSPNPLTGLTPQHLQQLTEWASQGPLTPPIESRQLLSQQPESNTRSHPHQQTPTPKP